MDLSPDVVGFSFLLLGIFLILGKLIRVYVTPLQKFFTKLYYCRLACSFSWP